MGFGFFVSAASLFRIISDTFIEGLEIRDDELSIYDFDIALWIDRAADMVDIRVIERANYLEDCIDISYV